MKHGGGLPLYRWRNFHCYGFNFTCRLAGLSNWVCQTVITSKVLKISEKALLTRSRLLIAAPRTFPVCAQVWQTYFRRSCYLINNSSDGEAENQLDTFSPWLLHCFWLSSGYVFSSTFKTYLNTHNSLFCPPLLFPCRISSFSNGLGTTSIISFIHFKELTGEHTDIRNKSRTGSPLRSRVHLGHSHPNSCYNTVLVFPHVYLRKRLLLHISLACWRREVMNWLKSTTFLALSFILLRVAHPRDNFQFSNPFFQF